MKQQLKTKTTRRWNKIKKTISPAIPDDVRHGYDVVIHETLIASINGRDPGIAKSAENQLPLDSQAGRLGHGGIAVKLQFRQRCIGTAE